MAKVMGQGAEFTGRRPEQVRSIQAPTLIMIGDGDIVRPEHAVEMYRLHAKAQLAILPGTDHFAPINRADWVVTMTVAFLEAP